MFINNFFKKIIPSTFSKIDSSVKILQERIENQQRQIDSVQNFINQKFIDIEKSVVDDLKPMLSELKTTVENESNWKRTDIVNDLRPMFSELKQAVENEANLKRADVVNDLRPILSELKQTVENEANWKRADVVNDLRPLFSELKQTVENESNWKIADCEKLLIDRRNELAGWISQEVNYIKDELHLSQSYDELRFWQLYKMPNEDDISAKKRFFMTMPKATGGLRLLQQGNAKLLKAFKKICEENNFTYWLQSGTMLGAVRHKGFVPWDDDTDVGMFRDDIEKLRELLKNDAEYKITLIYDWWAKSRQIRFRSTDDKIPCFVDVYIYDYCEDASDDYWKVQLEKREEIIKAIEEDNSEEVKFWKENPWISESWEQAEYLEKLFKKLTKCDSEKIPAEKSKGVCWGLDNFSVKWKRLFDNDFFFPLVDLEYENEKYTAPKENLSYVKRQYGDIYKLPKDLLSHYHHVSHEELEKKENMELLEKFINED